MLRHFTLEYWIDDDWYVGKLKEVPGVFSQGETLEELEENIKDAFILCFPKMIPHFKATFKLKSLNLSCEAP